MPAALMNIFTLKKLQVNKQFDMASIYVCAAFVKLLSLLKIIIKKYYSLRNKFGGERL